MRSTKTPRQTAQNASALHKHVGELLTSIEAFKGYEIRQEYPVKKVNPAFPSGREKFDWVILGAKIVVECHGEQHYMPVCFGGVDEDEAKRNLLAVQERDAEKKEAAEKVGWTYVVVRYDEPKITAEQLSSRIGEALAVTFVEKSMQAMMSMVASVKKTAAKKAVWPNRKIPSRPFPKKEKRNDKAK